MGDIQFDLQRYLESMDTRLMGGITEVASKLDTHIEQANERITKLESGHKWLVRLVWPAMVGIVLYAFFYAAGAILASP